MRTELRTIKQGFNWRDIFFALWHVATVRYVTPKQLRTHFPKNSWRIKCGTEGKLSTFAKKGLLQKTATGVYTAKPKTVDFLRRELHLWKEDLVEKGDFKKDTWRDIERKYNPEIISLGRGEGQKDMLYNTDVFLSLLKQNDFFALFYPIFTNLQGRPFLIPDGAILLKKKNKARLIFLEVEKKKPDWQGHIQKKKTKYEIIAQDDKSWSSWWKSQCELFGIKYCNREEFGFSVWCIGEIQPENWLGWEFMKTVY